MRSRRILLVLTTAGLLASCASVVDGSGRTVRTVGPASGSATGSLPTPSTASSSVAASTPPASGPSTDTGAQAATPCPHVVFPRAKLSFDCITTGFTPSFDSPTWPLVEARAVEAKTGWVLEEGAGHWGSAEGHTLGDIANAVRQHMIDLGGYGTKPNVDTVAAKDTTVGGVKAHLVQTTFTINPAWAKTRGTKVKQERLWIVALQVGSDDVSLWYTSIPDLAKSLWPKVPATIASIQVG